MADRAATLIIGCGALAPEVLAVTGDFPGAYDLVCLPAQWHNTPQRIAPGVQARIREEYTLAATARKLVDLYEKSVIPEARLALESSIASYQTGTLDFLSLFSNFMNVVDYELMYHEEIMQFHVALAKLEELTGMELEQ